MNSHSTPPASETLFGHPAGLFTLFFAEMWERFSYYGMRALLMFYMIKGFLGYGDNDAYAVYGAFTALVYMTPFFGGLLADRLLGARRAVILGGVLMAAGYSMMSVENGIGFFTALALLICGNGFFKPNISTIVGTLYPERSPKRDGGFTIFYMGVNLGAAMSPLLCGYIGETHGWHYGFGLATIGMLTGIAVFVAPSVRSQIAMALVALAAAVNVFVFAPSVREWLGPLGPWVEAALALPDLQTYMNVAVLVLLVAAGLYALAELGWDRLEESPESRRIARLVIMGGALAAAAGLLRFYPESPFVVGVNIFVALSLLIAGVIAWIALGRGGLPREAGAAPDAERLRRPVLGPISAEWMVYLGTAVSVGFFVLLVSGFALVTPDGRPVAVIPGWVVQDMHDSPIAAVQVLAVVVQEMSRPAGLVLVLSGLIAFAYLGIETFRLEKIPRERMFVVLILTFFSMLFWAFFEQAGSSINNFTDRNVDRVFTERAVGPDDLGKSIRLQPTQKQLGYHNGDRLFTIDALDKLRSEHRADPNFEIDWTIADDNVGMGLAGRSHEIPASTFQSVNPIYIMIFGLIFTALWGALARRGLEPSTPIKFSLGLLQLGLGFGAFWYGAQTADARGMVSLTWLLLGYMLHTTGELCLSPVGLSMVTKLSPARLVSTVMGAWFLATAFSQFLAAIIAQFTGVSYEANGESAGIPIPKETVHVYGDVFAKIALSALVSAAICFALSPRLSRWMHPEAVAPGEGEV